MGDNLPYRSKGDPEEAGRNDDPDEDEEEIDGTDYKTVKDAVLFAIEVNKSMLKVPQSASASKKSDNGSPLLAALKCAYHLMQQRIISTPKDLMGILLYGTEASKFYGEDETSKGGWSFPHCYLLTDLDVPEADDVKALKEMVEAEDPESNDLFKPAKEPTSMHNVLFCANQVFQQKAANFSSRRLFIVTDSDDPHFSNKESRSQATVRAKDLYDLGVTIELFPISTSDHAFDTKLFWDDIVYRSSPSDPEAIAYNPPSIVDIDSSKLVSGGGDGISLLQTLLSTIQSKVAPKRALFSSVPLEVGPDFKISVKGYLLYKHQKPARSSYIYLGGEKPAIVTGFAEQVADDEHDRRPVEKAEIRKAYTFGGEKVTFSDKEAKELRNWGDPVIRIIGFKPMSKLPMWANIKNSTFLYPSEEDFVGSTRVYSALHRKLCKDKLFGLAWFVPRKNATPVMAAMVPTVSAESNDKSNAAGVSATGAPQGLHLIPLPFADDIRQNPPSTHDTPVRAPDELVDAMRPIIRKFRGPHDALGRVPEELTKPEQLNLPKGIYDPSKYPNPSLQWHYRVLQALALDDEIPEKPEDKSIPKFRQIDKRVGAETIEWGKTLETVFKQYQADNPDAVSTGSKRPTSNGTTSHSTKAGPGKKVKMESEKPAINEAEIRQLWQQGQLAKLTVAELKDFCAMKKIPVAGKKADIVEKLEGWLESK